MKMHRSLAAIGLFSLSMLLTGGGFAPATASESTPLGNVAMQSAARMVPPFAHVAQSDATLDKLERSLEQMVNAERVKAGLKPLAFEVALSDIGRAHSAEMRDLNYFNHLSPTPGLCDACDRYCAACSTTPPVVAENIYRAWGGGTRKLGEADILQAHKSFMHSPTHRDNILFPKLTHIGVGIVTNGVGDIWITQMFIKDSGPTMH